MWGFLALEIIMNIGMADPVRLTCQSYHSPILYRYHTCIHVFSYVETVEMSL